MSKLLRNENIHNLVIDNIKLNDHTDIFGNLEKRSLPELNKDYSYETLDNANANRYNNHIYENILKKDKTKDLNNEFMSLYRIHSSKFHSRKEENEKKINDKLNEEINLLIKDNKNNEKLNLWNEPINSKVQHSYKNIFEFRKKMAFRFRFMNNPNKKISIKKNFKIEDEKVNKILKISKSIPNIFLKEEKFVKKTNKEINNNSENSFIEDRNKEIGFDTHFKLHRYSGNLYKYYKLINSLNKNQLVFNENENENENGSNIYNNNMNMNNEEINLFKSDNNNNNARIIKTKNIRKIKVNPKNKIIKLSSLL